MTLTLENENRVGDSDGDESDLIGDEPEDDAEEQSEEQSEDEDEEEDPIITSTPGPVLLAGQEWDDKEILRLKCLSGQLAILKCI